MAREASHLRSRRTPYPPTQPQAIQGISITALGYGFVSLLVQEYLNPAVTSAADGCPEPRSRRLPLLPQQLLQHPNPLIYMLLLQQKRRQKPHHSILCTVEQNSLSERRIHNRPRRNIQIDPLNKSSPPHFLGGR